MDTQELKNLSIPSDTKSFTELLVWQKAHEFVLNTYEFTRRFPKDELIGFTDQFRRATVNIATDISEGTRQTNPSEKLRIMVNALGILQKCKY